MHKNVATAFPRVTGAPASGQLSRSRATPALDGRVGQLLSPQLAVQQQSMAPARLDHCTRAAATKGSAAAETAAPASHATETASILSFAQPSASARALKRSAIPRGRDMAAKKAKGIKPHPGYFQKYVENPIEIGAIRSQIKFRKCVGSNVLANHLLDIAKITARYVSIGRFRYKKLSQS